MAVLALLDKVIVVRVALLLAVPVVAVAVLAVPQQEVVTAVLVVLVLHG
jgi:hypothetical protein